MYIFVTQKGEITINVGNHQNIAFHSKSLDIIIIIIIVVVVVVVVVVWLLIIILIMIIIIISQSIIRVVY